MNQDSSSVRTRIVRMPSVCVILLTIVVMLATRKTVQIGIVTAGNLNVVIINVYPKDGSVTGTTTVAIIVRN